MFPESSRFQEKNNSGGWPVREKNRKIEGEKNEGLFSWHSDFWRHCHEKEDMSFKDVVYIYKQDYGALRAKPVVSSPTPMWGDIPVTRSRIPPRPKAVVSCCRNETGMDLGTY